MNLFNLTKLCLFGGLIFYLNINFTECKYRKYKLVAVDYPIKAVAAIEGQVQNPMTGQYSQINGYVKFQQNQPNDLVIVSVNVSGLIPNMGNSNHGFHVHAFGINSTSANATIRCGSCGPHYNPAGNFHGDISFPIRHVGDLGNIILDDDGTIINQLYDSVIQLDGANSVIGRTIVLHANQDDKGLNPDEGSKTTGNSGARIACGVIGYDPS